MQPPLMSNQVCWYEARWYKLYNQPTDERLCVAICNGLPRLMQNKLDQKDCHGRLSVVEKGRVKRIKKEDN
jgi:hypothetical protein